METDSLAVRFRKDLRFRPRFDGFRTPAGERIGSWGKDRPIYLPSDPDKAYDWIVSLNRAFFERFGVSMEDFKKLAKKKGNGGNSWNGEGSFEGRRIGRPKFLAHIRSIPRPQDEYNILVNNKNEPFQHVWLEKSEDGTRVVHPLEKLSVVDFAARSLSGIAPVKPPAVDNFPFKLVEEVKDLKELAAKLKDVDEFAVDLEHNQYRSFQGLTCLMQISTRTEDFVIDTLKLRIHVGPYLRESFKDPCKRKVMHGADCDIEWLQRDFGIYVCNLFDTGQASRVMQLEKNSLEYLLLYFCGVNANKEYQNSDWRLRPIPDEMLKYAREDTHYLLHIYDLIRSRLLSSSDGNGENLLIEIYKRSYATCMHLYEKELLTDSSYTHIYGLQEANFNSQQLAIVSGLYKWRDAVARAEDESTGYILPNKTLLEIARQMPPSSGKLRHLVKSKWPFIERDLNTVSSIINHSIRSASAFEGAVEKGRHDIAYNQYIGPISCSSVYIPAEHPVSTFLQNDVHNLQIVHIEENAAASASGNSNHVKPTNEGHFDSQIQGERSQLLPLPKIGRFFMPSITAEDMKTDDDSTQSSQSACTYMYHGSSVETSESTVTFPFHSFSRERRLLESHSAEVPMQSHTGTLQACRRPSEDSELQEAAPHNGVEDSSHPGKFK